MRGKPVLGVLLVLVVVGLVVGAATPAAPDCTWDACVRCELKPNGQWTCKIVFQNAYCNCDVLGGAGCSQGDTCRMIP